MQPQNANNDFFGIRVSKPGINVNNAASSQSLIYESDYSTDTWYGQAGQPAVQVGLLADGNYGLRSYDQSGNLNTEFTGATWKWYDNEGRVVMEVGYLPVTQVYGWAVATPGNTLEGQV